MSARKFDVTKAKKYGNVMVYFSSKNDELYTKVYLHDNCIMTINRTKKWFTMTDCGWVTNTTKTALNTALKQIRPDMAVYQEKGVWYVSFANGEEVSPFSCVENKKYGF